MEYIDALPQKALDAYVRDVLRATNTSELMRAMRKHGIASERDPQDLPALTSALHAKRNSRRVYEEFWTAILPDIAERARHIHALFPFGIPVVTNNTLFTCTREQCASILCGMFLGIFPAPREHGAKSGLAFPRLNSFLQLLIKGSTARVQMFLAYFAALSDPESEQTLKGSIYIRRVAVNPATTCALLDASDEPVHVPTVLRNESISSIEGELQVDFANKFIGGGSLNKGSVQEEILFAEAPEHVVTMLMCPMLKDNEAITITGAGHWAKSSGYSRNVRFEGPNRDAQGRTLGDHGVTSADLVDPDTIAKTTVAIDAVRFAGSDEPFFTVINRQLQRDMIDRECVKAYAGFSAKGNELEYCKEKVATGNWGCGAFGGHRQIKAAIQWVAASAAGRRMTYCCFKEEDIAVALDKAVAALKAAAAKGTVPKASHLYKALIEVAETFKLKDLNNFLVNVVSRAIERAEGEG